MEQLLQISFTKVAAATNNFAATRKIGEGATGEVFEGDLDGVPIAAKCLKLPPAATPEAMVELRRRFDAERATLTRFLHTRVVKIIGFAVGEPGAQYPLVLVLEFLEEGSLADWLRDSDGSASAKGILTAIERVDIAQGACAGLAYFHGLRDETDGPVVGGGGGGGGAAGSPVLHRDVKSANIGLTRLVKGGPLSPKILDCGLAKAIRGADGAAAAAAGVSFTGGLIAGTAGYMAPEVSNAEYTIKSEVRATQSVLLCLFRIIQNPLRSTPSSWFFSSSSWASA